MQTKKIIIDTNSLLHYRLFTDINWCEELKCDNVIIIITTTVLNELDKKKYSADINVGNRARRVLSKFSDYIGELDVINIKPNIQLRFITSEPRINWELENLDPTIPDDRIIAKALELVSEYKGDITIITADIGLKLKANSKKIGVNSLSESLLIKTKKSEEEKEILKLKNKLAIYENRQPQLFLNFLLEKETSKILKVNLKRIEEYSEIHLKKVLDDLRQKLNYETPKVDSSDVSEFLGVKMNFSLPLKDEVDRYNKEVDKYLKDYEKYYKNEWKYREDVSRIIEINFVLINEGTTPADDIDIFIHFPDGFEMFKSKNYPNKPRPPQKPEPPRSMNEIIRNGMDLKIPSSLINHHIPTFNNYIPTKMVDYSPKIKKTNSYEVEYQIERLKHGLKINLDPVYIMFDTFENANSFSIDYKIISGNHPENFEDKLHLIVNK